jgi:hypothetical protein
VGEDPPNRHASRRHHGRAFGRSARWRTYPCFAQRWRQTREDGYGAAILQGGAIDGSIAYRQFRQSDDPYDPVFLKNRRGTVEVEPLTPLRSNDNKRPAKEQRNDQIPPSAPPRSA